MTGKAQSKQAELPLTDTAKNVKPEKPPATRLMKMVAEKAPSSRRMQKVFTDEEIEDILKKRDQGRELETEERMVLKERYRKIKRQVKEMEKDNQSRLIVFPSLTNGDGWYKVVEFSALYYVYRLAERMGRRARIYKDSDKFSKCIYSATFQNIEKLVAQLERLGEIKGYEITLDGVYIFVLKRALTDDEVGQLRQIEETRRERMHNVLKPRAMDPATYQAILMVVRQLAPKIKKLPGQAYMAVGEKMMGDLQGMLSIYFDFTNGIMERKEAGVQLLTLVDRIFAGLTILGETRVWQYSTVAVIGENVNVIRRIVIKDFNLKVGKE